MPKLTFIGAFDFSRTDRPSPTVEGFAPEKAWVNYYIGNDPARWRAKLPVHKGMRITGVAHGVDLDYWATETMHHHTLTFHPGFDFARLLLGFTSEPVVDTDGSLITQHDGGKVRLRNPSPRAWQVVDGRDVEVIVRWMKSPYSTGAPTLAFGRVDPALPMHVTVSLHRYAPVVAEGNDAYDPELFRLTGAVAVDGDQSVYLAGTGETTGGPVLFDLRPTDGSLPRSSRNDVAIEKFNAAGELVYTSFIGGAFDDGKIVALKPDGKGNVYVAATSAWADLVPLTAGAPCATDCEGLFVAKLGPEGQLLDSRVVTGVSGIKHMVVDANGVVTVIGHRRTPLIDAAAARGWRERDDFPGYVARIDATKTDPAARVWAMHLSWLSEAQALAVDNAGFIYVGGSAWEGRVKEPLPNPGYRDRINGEGDAYVVQLDPTKTGPAVIAASTFIGGGGYSDEWERVLALDVDDGGNVYAAGSTTAPNFPVTDGVWRRKGGGREEAFICKFGPGLKTLRWATFLGGARTDAVTALRVDRNRNVYVAGTTTAPDFPTVLAPSTQHRYEFLPDGRGIDHVFAAKLNATASSLLWSTIVSGGKPLPDVPGNYLAVGGRGEVHLAGESKLRHESLSPFHGELGSYSYMGSMRISPCESCPAGPSITRIERSRSSIDIFGRGLGAATVAFIGGVPAAVTSREPGRLTVSVPEHLPAEPLEIAVVNPDDQSAAASLPPAPSIAALLPTGEGRSWWPVAAGGALAAVVAVILLMIWLRRR